MKYALLSAALLATLGLAACEKTVVAPPTPSVVAVPGPSSTTVVPVPVPGPPGAPGAPGADGAKGKDGETLVIVPAK